jgi:hypothetical protein
MADYSWVGDPLECCDATYDFATPVRHRITDIVRVKPPAKVIPQVGTTVSKNVSKGVVKVLGRVVPV